MSDSYFVEQHRKSLTFESVVPFCPLDPKLAYTPGGIMPKINQEVLAEVPVPLPAPEVRAQIASRVDSAMRLADSIERRVAVIARRVQHGEQAILAKAFRGDLGVAA